MRGCCAILVLWMTMIIDVSFVVFVHWVFPHVPEWLKRKSYGGEMEYTQAVGLVLFVVFVAILFTGFTFAAAIASMPSDTKQKE